MPSQEPQKKTTQDSSNEDPQQKTALAASPSDKHQEAPRGRTSRRKSVIGRRASRRVSDVQSFSPQPPPPPPQQPNTFSPVQSYAPTKQKLEAMLSPATTGSNAENQPPQAKKMETKPLSPEIEVKVKAFSLYEMNLASSGSSGLEANAGSFASTCITVISPGIPSPGISSPGTRRRKSEYEKKIEEQKRWSCPETLALPDIAASAAEKPKGKLRPKSINTSREQGVEDDHDRTPQRKGRPSPSDFDKGHKSPKSPIARVRNEQEKQRKTEQLNKLRYGTANPINNKTDEGVVSPRRLKLVGSQDDTSWISVPPHQTSPKPNHAMENTPQVQTSRTPNDKTHSTVKKKAAVFQSSATNAASQRFSFDRTGGRNNTNNKDDKTSKSPSTRSRKSPIHRPRKSPNNRSGKIRMPGISSPKADFKLDPFKITPPSFLGGSRLFNATATNDSETSKPGNKLASPRGVLQSSSPQNFGKPSSLKRAC
ncbi:expressed unknown protein [Seminavis robusta]|uniref:Uncharacterized protein n=1 Tax=Seminavis robusta TaxID=568900 RepID=A0A9N8ETR5_9STRA|nr:expressed unknown protein [Seminavis robusta]|eukprot:Sro1795_g298060.1 n/a (482) ;mRNA; f:15711-17156